MKKLTSLVTALCLLIAGHITAAPVTPDSALLIARAYMADSHATPHLVARARRTATSTRRLAPAVAATSPYYIYSRGTGQGFVIVSGDDCLPAILGYTESGDYDPALLPPHFFAWLDSYADLIERVQDAGGAPSRRDAKRLAPKGMESRPEIPALLTTHWHQSWPYNNQCPVINGTGNRAATGCVATAASQVVKYFHRDNPDRLLASTTIYDNSAAAITDIVPKGTPMKWAMMRDTYGQGEPEDYQDAVATLVYALGAATHLVYDASTSGQISDLVGTLDNFFNLSSTSEYKSDGTNTWVALPEWEKRIYADLSEGRPIVYTGYHADQGGHAVVIDGYRPSGYTSLFHFNFGWGGQGDGWYTVDDETGMNGFRMWQGMTYRVTPKHQNLTASMTLPQGFRLNQHNPVKVRVSNHGTLAYSGLYLFTVSAGAKATSLSAAKDQDTGLTLSADSAEHELTLSVRATSDRPTDIVLTDRNLNELCRITAQPVKADNTLAFGSIRVMGSSAAETHNGHDYTIVHSERATVRATLHNQSGYAFEDTPRLALYKSDDEGRTFTPVGTKTVANASIAALDDGDIDFLVASTSSCPVATGTLYRAALMRPLTSRGTATVTYDTADTLAYFILHAPEPALEATRDGHVLTFTGQWDAYRYGVLAKRATNRDATVFDLTQVENVGEVPQVEGKDGVLIYVARGSRASGVNIVRDDHTAASLTLHQGQDFEPRADITAATATFTLHTAPRHWALVTYPFAAAVPDGVTAKRIDSHSLSGINSRTTVVSAVEAGKTYLTMTTTARHATFTAHDVTVAAAPRENADTAVVGTYVTAAAPAGACVMNDDTEQFEPQDEATDIAPFGGYFLAANLKRSFRAASNATLDAAFVTLAEAIEAAYGALDEYRDIVTTEATQNLTDSIVAAEAFFSVRQSENSGAVKIFAQRLKDFTAAHRQNFRDVLTDVCVDVSSLIANPSFEQGASATSTVGSLRGWTAGTGAVVRQATDMSYMGVGADGRYLLYNSAQAADGDATAERRGSAVSQRLTGLHPGYYRLTALLGTDTGAAVTLRANGRTATVQGHDFGKNYLTTAVLDSIAVSEGQDLEIGVCEGTWYKADDFRLYYLGTLPAVTDPTGIVQTHDGGTPQHMRVSLIAGGVRLQSERRETVTIRTISGVTVHRAVVDGQTDIMLPRGLYIVAGTKVAVSE